MAERMAPRFRRKRSRSTSTHVGNSMSSSAEARPPDDYHTPPPGCKRYTCGMAPPGSDPAPARDRSEFGAALSELLDLVRHLSGPEGCPWDREQTTRTLSPYVVE